MVVVDQHLVTAGAERVVSRCIDVRLRRDGGGSWALEAVADTSGVEVAPSALSAEARAALDHPGISWPDSARWDVYEGVLDPRVLRELVAVADQFPIAVTTCRRGHPEHVFGTSRLSAHTVGRAVDIWAVDGPVVQQRGDDTSPAFQVAQGIYQAGRIHNLGSPWYFGGPARRSFTDPVHQDHLHLGVDP